MIRTILITALTVATLTHTPDITAATSEQAQAGINPAGVVANRSSRTHELLDHGREYLGVRYRRGGNSPETGLDCSGLVQNVFRNALGLQLPRAARDMARLGLKVGRNELQPGDLVFFNTTRQTISHVGIYMGEGQFLHAPSSGGVVRIEALNGRYWATRFVGARRLLDEGRG